MPDLTSSSNNNNDDLLVAAVLRGDTGAFREIIFRYEKLVISIVFKMIGRREDCEDICQDVFMKVFERMNTFRFQSKLSTWIGSIAFNTCVNFLQKSKPLLLEDMNNPAGDEKSPNGAELSIKDQGTSPDERLLMKEQEILLLRGIEDLSVIQKTVLQLFHQSELSLQEISMITSLPVSTVKSHLFRARKRLRQIMNKYQKG